MYCSPGADSLRWLRCALRCRPKEDSRGCFGEGGGPADREVGCRPIDDPDPPPEEVMMTSSRRPRQILHPVKFEGIMVFDTEVCFL